MELRSVASVVGRHRVAATVGVLLAVGLAILSAFRLDLSRVPPLERRQATVYESSARVFVTQQGFPWGRSTLRYLTPQGQPPLLEGDPDRFAQLAQLYAQLANSTVVQGVLSPAEQGAVTAEVVNVSAFSSSPLPLIDITAKSPSPVESRRLAKKVTDSLLTFMEKSQARSRIAPQDRVVLQVIDPAHRGKVFKKPSPALPALVFLTILFASIGGIFILDNWRGGRGQRRDVVAPTAMPKAAVTPVHVAEPVASTHVAASSELRPRHSRRSSPTLGQRSATLADTESGARPGAAAAAGDE